MVCENCLHRTVCEYSYTMTERYGCIYHSRKENIIIPELENIKKEIDEPMRDTTDSYGRGYACAMFKCLDIIDKHIAELKGENK